MTPWPPAPEPRPLAPDPRPLAPDPRPPESDLRPREFAVALVMAATWYFAGPLGIVPTVWFVYLILREKPRWIAGSARLLPVAQRRALTAQTQRLQAGWAQLSAPWRAEEPALLPAPAGWQGDEPLAGARPATVQGEGLGLGVIAPIALADLAAAPNVLLVGSPGSGKSTLLHALLARRPQRCYVLDPHSHPAKWPSNATPIGGGRAFPAIYGALQRIEAELTARAQRLSSDARARFAPLTLAGDEWGAVSSEIVVPKDGDPPGRLLTRLLKEGRKFGISFVGAAHGDTAASLGSAGDTAAFRYCFDAIVYMGGFVARQLRDQPELLRRLPQGRTPEGKTFPLLAVVVTPSTGERRLLDLRTIAAAGQGPGGTAGADPWVCPPGTPATPAAATVAPPAATIAPPAATVSTPTMPTATQPAPQPDEQPTRQPGLPTVATRDDIVRMLVRQGWSVSQIREVVKGDNSVISELVRRVVDAEARG